MIGVRTEEQKGKGGQRGESGSFHPGGTSTGRVSKTGGEVKWRAVKSLEKRARALNNCLLSFWHPPPHLPLSVSQHSRQTACSYWPTPTQAAQTLAAREGWGGRANLLQPKQASVSEKWKKRPKNAKWGLGEGGSALSFKNILKTKKSRIPESIYCAWISEAQLFNMRTVRRNMSI